ncbi:MAG: tetratricopeptide repeat protein [Bacteroidetes bacterium]|nr:tetratricopeptide repeat protein [Bacteroidota bacterium]
MTLETANNAIRKRASSFMEQREWKAALIDWNIWFSSTEKDHLDPNAYHDRAICKFHTGSTSEAIEDLNEAANLQPDYSYRFASRGWMKQAAGHTDAAIEDYKHAIELDPEDTIAHNNLGLLEEAKGYKAQAQERFKVADELQEILNQTEKTTEIDAEAEVGAKVPKKETVAKPEKSIWGEVKSVFTDQESRKLWWKFIRNGFTLKD